MKRYDEGINNLFYATKENENKKIKPFKKVL
jgi:hypothetical protein